MNWKTDLKAAPSDPDAAARVLGHASGFMLRGEALPEELAEYLGRALAVAARQATNKEVADTLVYNLYLARDAAIGRPRALPDADVVFLDYGFGDEDHPSLTKWVKAYAARHRVAESTVWNRVRAAQRADEAHAREMTDYVESLTPSELEAFLKDPDDPL
ncbi:hypothetical protein ACKVEX_06480 [Rhodocyclaceae bacterium SMB388]